MGLGLGPGSMGFNILCRNVRIGPKQGQVPGHIVSYCASPFPRFLKCEQESISLGCVPPACADRTCFNSHQMSALVGRSHIRRESLYSEVSWLEGGAGPGGWSLCSEISCLGGSLYSEVPWLEGVPVQWCPMSRGGLEAKASGALYSDFLCIMGGGHIGLP